MNLPTLTPATNRDYLAAELEHLTAEQRNHLRIYLLGWINDQVDPDVWRRGVDHAAAYIAAAGL